MIYDYLIVGAGIFGATFAAQIKNYGGTCLVVEQRSHSGGNCYDEIIDGIRVHKYGPHIFHTNSKYIWDYVNSFVEFDNYRHQVFADTGSEIVQLPINLNTLNKLFGINTPAMAEIFFESVRQDVPGNSIESWCLNNIGLYLYEKLIKGYTIKQWGMHPKDLPESIIKRLPIRTTYDNNYYFDKYQGLPLTGYSGLINKMLNQVPIEYNTDYIANKKELDKLANCVVFSGKLDELYNYKYGKLTYKTVSFEMETLPIKDAQGTAQINYTSLDVPYKRRIEYKHLSSRVVDTNSTILVTEYSNTSDGIEAYPINDDRNNSLYKIYRKMAEDDDYIIGGRLGSYQYMDMHQVIAQAITIVERLI